MVSVEYLRQLAHRIRDIARRCFDLGPAGELRQLSDEIEAKASSEGQLSVQLLDKDPRSTPAE